MSGNGELEYQLMVMKSPNSPPELMNMGDIPDEALQRIVLKGTERLYQLQAEVETLTSDLSAARMEAAK